MIRTVRLPWGGPPPRKETGNVVEGFNSWWGWGYLRAARGTRQILEHARRDSTETRASSLEARLAFFPIGGVASESKAFPNGRVARDHDIRCRAPLAMRGWCGPIVTNTQAGGGECPPLCGTRVSGAVRRQQ